MTRTVGIVPTGTANRASVEAAFRRLGVATVPAASAAAVLEAEHLVLPGVGAFAAARARLDELGLCDALRERIAAGRPTLCICLGLQLLCEASEEDPGSRGLGILPGVVRRFPAVVAVPQLGWNEVEAPPGARLLERGHAYFANSYRLERAPPPFLVATSDHGGPFVAAVEAGALLACQFHPELSGAYGRRLLERWLQEAPC